MPFRHFSNLFTLEYVHTDLLRTDVSRIDKSRRWLLSARGQKTKMHSEELL